MVRRAALVAAAVTVPLLLASSASAATRPVCSLAGSSALKEDRVLTVGTDNPAFTPWFGGGERTRPWRVNDPNSGQGYESAVAYEVARRIGFRRSAVKWIPVRFAQSFAPGRKPFDLFINQVSFTPQRARNVSFSVSYYNVAQAIVAKRSNRASEARTVSALREFRFGAQVGTTSLDAINNRIRPTQQAQVFDSNEQAVAALNGNLIDALVVDLPTAYFVTAVQVRNSRIVGQLPQEGTPERFGIVAQKGSPLTRCVNRALNQMRRDRTLARLETRWLAGAAAPVLRP